MSSSTPSFGMWISRVFLHAAVLALGSAPLFFAQSTVGTGSIVGTVSDPSGAVINGARVMITNLQTHQVINVVSSSSGIYNSGALVPGNYKTLVSAKSFSSAESTVTVLVSIRLARLGSWSSGCGSSFSDSSWRLAWIGNQLIPGEMGFC